MIEGYDFYYAKNGLMVFTRQYHLKRGYCCGNGCLHCPYSNGGLQHAAEPLTQNEAGEATKPLTNNNDETENN